MPNRVSLCARGDSNPKPSDPKSEVPPGYAPDSASIRDHSRQETTQDAVSGPTIRHITSPETGPFGFTTNERGDAIDLVTGKVLEPLPRTTIKPLQLGGAWTWGGKR